MQDGSLAVVLEDVSGHGFDAALLMSATIGHLRVLATHCTSIGQLLGHLNQLIAEETEGQFVTLFVLQLEPATGRLSFASAGQPGFCLRPNGAVKKLSGHCPPLGVVRDLEIPTSTSIEFEPGSINCIHTDGLSEAMNANDEFFGVARIIESVRTLQACEAAAITDVICNQIRQFSSVVGQNDDMTMVVIKKTFTGL
jgi:sigma-B regulation protein RsbU (phosphoserine phosphatase)